MQSSRDHIQATPTWELNVQVHNADRKLIPLAYSKHLIVISSLNIVAFLKAEGYWKRLNVVILRNVEDCFWRIVWGFSTISAVWGCLSSEVDEKQADKIPTTSYIYIQKSPFIILARYQKIKKGAFLNT